MKSYFFDSSIVGMEPDGTPVYDRPYQAKDHAHFYKGMFSNGVLGGLNQDALKVVESVETQAGITIRRLHVSPGRCMIEGYQGDADETDMFLVNDLADGLYRIVARLDNNEDVRDVLTKLLTGSDEEYPALVREGNIYDLCLAQFRIIDGVPLDLEDTRINPELCGFSTINKSPPYYPPTELPQLLWQYAMFPDTLTDEQRTEIEGNESLMALFRENRFSKAIIASGEKKLTATLTSSGAFVIADYGLKIGDKVDIYEVGGGGGGRGALTGGAGGTGGGGGYCKLIRDFVLSAESYSCVIGSGGAAGAGGGSTSGFGYSVPGGGGGGDYNGGSGGSGGGGNSSGSGGLGGGGGGGGAGGAGGGNINYQPFNPYDGIFYGCGGGGGGGAGGGAGGAGGGATGGSGGLGGGGGGGNSAGSGGLGGGGGGGGAGAGSTGGSGGKGLIYIYA